MNISKKMAEELSRLRLSGREWQMLWAIIARDGEKSSLKEFSQLTGIIRQNCFKGIKSLIRKGVINSDYCNQNRLQPLTYSFNYNYDKRLSSKLITSEIKESSSPQTPLFKEIHISSSNNTTNKKDSVKGKGKDIKDPNIYIYNKYKNKVLKETVKEVIEYLNLKSGKNFRTNTPATITVINARLMEGFTIEDFKKAIDVKCPKWKDDPEMEMYLRPITLFCKTKFEGYTQEKLPVTKEEDFEKKKREFIEMGKKEKDKEN